MRILDLGFGLGLGAGVGGGRQAIGLIDRSGLGLLLRLLRILRFGRAPGIKIVDSLDDPLELLAQPVVGAYVEVAAQQVVQCIVEILLGVIGFSGMVVVEAGLVFLLDLSDQVCNGVCGRSRSSCSVSRCRLLGGSVYLLLWLRRSWCLGRRRCGHWCSLDLGL